jgi:hypothetical protein
MKKYKIYATELSELEQKLNYFFEKNPWIDVRTIHPSQHIATTEFARGINRRQIVFSILYD